MDDMRQELIERYLGQAEDLPTLPYIVVQILEKMHDKNPQIEKIADLIMTDQVLTAQMFQMVNSAFWGLNRKITSIRETIIYLGLRQVETLVYSVALTNTFEQDAPLLKRVHFWEHSFGCAMISRIISERVGFKQAESAYLAGLLHDIGEVILAVFLSKKFEKVVEYVLENNTSFYLAEDHVMGFNHTDLGPWLVERWKLPATLSNVISDHHHLSEAEEPLLTTIVRLADLICIYYQLDFGINEGERLTVDIMEAWRKLNSLAPKPIKLQIKPFLDEFEEQIDIVKSTVAEVYRLNT